MSQTPSDLDDLIQSLNLWDELNERQHETMSKIQPLYDKFNLLEKYEVDIADNIRAIIAGIGNEWQVFQNVLTTSGNVLKKQKVRIKLCTHNLRI